MARKTKSTPMKFGIVLMHVLLGVMTSGLWWIGMLIWFLMKD